VPALEALRGMRIVASEAAIDGGRWQGDHALALRLAPDEVLVLAPEGVRVFEEGAIYDLETGFVGAWLDPSELEAVRGRMEWVLPGDRPALAQGKVAGVPARLWLGEDGRCLLLTHAAYADELQERLGWR
jgi:hypothetical protein